MDRHQSFLRGQRSEIKKKSQGNWLAWLNLIGFLGMVTVNYLANALPLNNLNTGQLSDKYPNLFVPAGITFSIWGVIYVLLAVFVFFSLKQVITGREVFPAFKQLGFLFFLTCLANAGWIFAWHYQQLILSLLLMLVLLALLIKIYKKLEHRSLEERKREKFPAKIPFSIYLAWICVATVANITAILVAFRWNRFGLSEQFWAVVVLIFVLTLTLIYLFKKKDFLFSLTIIWALIGIIYKRIQDTASPDRAVEITTIACLGIILLSTILQIPRKRKISTA